MPNQWQYTKLNRDKQSDESIMAGFEFSQAIDYAWTCLSTQLSPILTYHSLWHTQYDVVQAVQRLASLEGLEGEEKALLITAAWYHDIGFTRQRDDHEHVGIGIAGERLPDFGYSKGQIEAIQGMILATKLPQSPTNVLEEMLADADLDGLGRDDFLKTSLMLKAELAAFGINRSYPEWYLGQKGFLGSQQYWRASTRHLRDNGKAHNIQVLGQLLAEWEALSST
jgi:uncharacterized protein